MSVVFVVRSLFFEGVGKPSFSSRWRLDGAADIIRLASAGADLARKKLAVVAVP